ncbi:MAG: chemotaxis protein CheB [Lachnospiraceae bacterium]|nr:chemotaxis protein CheB [Lachnospiraceae bacterium]
MADSIRKLVVIASSTGGPKALHTVIPDLSERLDAPVVIVQHMPKGFTNTLAERLNSTSAIPVSEVVDGQMLEKGHVYLAKGGKHLEIIQDRKGNLAFKESEKDPVNGLRPCANITFHSLNAVALDYIICVVLTGMGADGYLGVKELHKNKQIYTIAQDEESCVVYGMPKAIVENGLADIVLPLDDIGQEINKKTGVR